MEGKTSGKNVLIHPNALNSRKTGMSVAMPGRSIVARHSAKILSRPGHRTREKLKATIAETKTSPSMGMTVVINELPRNRVNGAAVQPLTKFSKTAGCGIHTGGKA